MHYGTLLITMVMASPYLSRSSTLHNLQEIYPAKRAPCQYCNHSPQVLHDSLTSKELPTTSLDDAGVYFVLSDVISFHTQFTDLLFLISNPINFASIAKTRRTKKEFQSKENIQDKTSEQVKTYNDKHVNKQGNSKIIVYSPLYLDLNIQVADNLGNSSLQEIIFIMDFERTERGLDECLDLHVLDYMRRYGIVEEFKEFWKTSNIKKYDNLTDFDLNDRMRKHCSNPESMVKQTFYDIKSGALYGKADNMSDLKTKERKRTHDASDFITTTISTTPSNLESLFLPMDLPSMIKTTDYDDTYATQTNTNNTEVRASSGFVVTTENNTIFHDTDNLSNMSNITHEQILKYNDFDMDTIAASLVTDNYNKITLGKADHEQNNDEITSATPTTTTLKDIFLLKDNFDENNVLTDDTFTTSVTLTTTTLKEDSLTTPILPPKNHRKLKKIKIEIPRLLTKECNNNTVKSLIDGIEVIPNNDLMNLQIAPEQSHVKNSFPDNEELTKNTLDREPIFHDSEYITGNIYFGTSKELIPIRFQQTESGKINLSIDGNSVCDKLFRMTTKKSLLLTTLCELHQNIQRKNSTVEH